MLEQISADPSFVLGSQDNDFNPAATKQPATVGIYTLHMTAVTQGTVFTPANEAEKKTRKVKGGWTARKWTDQDIELLLELHKNGNSTDIIAKSLDRTPKAIAQRLVLLRRAEEPQ
jgi:hypothetical protein